MPRIVPFTSRPRGKTNRPPVALDLDVAWGLYDRQARFVGNDSLFSLFLGGVGSGKSYALTAWVLRRALANANGVGALLGRTSIDLQTVLLPTLFDQLQQAHDQCGVSLIKDYDKGNARLTLVNGCKLYFRPYNRIAKLRGLTLTFGAADEVEWSEADPDEVWSVLTGRMRGPGPLPGLAFATSPNGLRGTTKRFVDAQRAYADGDAAAARYYTVTSTSFCNPHLPDHFFDSLRSMSKRRYQQEVEGKVLRPLHSVWQLEPRHMVGWRWQDHPELQRVYGIDWGGQDHHVALMLQVRDNGQWVACDELVCDDMPRGQFHDRLLRWIDGHGAAEPALAAADRAAPVENQRLQARYRRTPVRWMKSKDEQQIAGGIELVRDMMDPLDGDPQLVIADTMQHTTTGVTAPLIPALRGYCYHLDKMGQPTRLPKKDNVNDHICDALRYIVSAGAHDPRLHGGDTLWASGRLATVDRGPGHSGRQVI